MGTIEVTIVSSPRAVLRLSRDFDEWRGDRVNCLCRGSAERERKRLDAGVKKLDLEPSMGDAIRSPGQLIHPVFGHGAVALGVNLDPVSGARRLSMVEHAKPHGGPGASVCAITHGRRHPAGRKRCPSRDRPAA
jgi:hypothetical protein